MALPVVIYYATTCILPALPGCVEHTRAAKAFSWFMLVFALLSLVGSGSILVYQVSAETMERSIDKEVCACFDKWSFASLTLMPSSNSNMCNNS